MVIGVDGTAITVGTDDESLAAYLRRWEIEAPAELVHFGLRVNPEQPTERSAPRELPSLKFGSDVLARSSDVAMLRSALLRMIAAVSTTPSPELLRLRSSMVEFRGHAYLVPEGNLRSVSIRMLERLGIRPWFAQTVLLDPVRGSIHLDPELGSDAGGLALPLGGWWFNHREPGETVSDGEHLARVLGHLDHRRSGDGSTEVLESLVVLMAAVPPRYLAYGRVELENALTALAGGE